MCFFKLEYPATSPVIFLTFVLFNLRASFALFFVEIFISCFLGIARIGLGSTLGFLLFFKARASVLSSPVYPLCTGTQTNITLFEVDNLIGFANIPKLVFSCICIFKDFNHVWLSKYMIALSGTQMGQKIKEAPVQVYMPRFLEVGFSIPWAQWWMYIKSNYIK